MRNKVCVVTGAASGIGMATATALAAGGATVILACRNAEQKEPARETIRARSGSDAVHLLDLDLASLESVRQFQAKLQNLVPRLDVLINNAGVISRHRKLTQDGFELQFGVNHLGHFLLTLSLLPMLEDSEAGRVVVLSSAVHRAGKIAWEDLNSDADYGMMKAYAQSKLANLLFAHELAKRVRKVVVNSVHPGAAATGIMRDFPPAVRGLTRLVSRSAGRGARGPVHLATAPEVADVNGRYFVGPREAIAAPAARDDIAARKLWEVSTSLTAPAA